MTEPGLVAVLPLRRALERAAEWDALHAATGASPFMSAAWHAGWVGSGEAGDAFVIVQRNAGGTVEAIFPFSIRRLPYRRVPFRTLTWAVSDTAAPDHLDLLAAPTADLAPLARQVLSLPWTVLHLGALAESAPGARRLAAELVTMGCHVDFHTYNRCPFIDLPATWEGLLHEMSSSRRENVRRKERALFKRYHVEVEQVPPDRFEEGWNTLVSLHEKRWDQGVLGGAGRLAQHRAMVADGGAAWETWLSILRADGRPVAAWYGFAANGTVSYYQGGRDPAYGRDSVGQVLMGIMIRRAIERGFRRFDFMRGEEPYKFTWTDTVADTHALAVVRPGLTRVVRQTLDLLAALRTTWRSDGAASGETS